MRATVLPVVSSRRSTAFAWCAATQSEPNATYGFCGASLVLRATSISGFTGAGADVEALGLGESAWDGGDDEPPHPTASDSSANPANPLNLTDMAMPQSLDVIVVRREARSG